MEVNNKLLEKISSKVILKKIFNYIQNDMLKYKLFIHSKLFQEKLDIHIYDYKEIYLNKREINLFDYWKLDYNKYDEDIIKKLKENLLYTHTNNKIIKPYLLYYINKYNNKLLSEFNENKIIINIFSKLLQTFSSLNIFDKIFSILINKKKEYKINDIKKLIDYLNNNNIKYPSIIYQYKNTEHISYLKYFNINFKQIKKLTLTIKQKFECNKKNCDNFFNTLLICFNENYNNLIYLDIQIQTCHIKSDLINKLNDFKNLETLKLKGFLFKTPFILKFNNLKSLELIDCENILLDNNYCLNIKYIVLDDTKIINKELLCLPNLEICKLEKFDINKFDTSSFINLKIIEGFINKFFLINSIKLEKIEINFDKSLSDEDFKNSIEKLLLINTLEEIKIKMDKSNISYYLIDHLGNIKIQNKSVKKFFLIYESSDLLLHNLDKFTNKLLNLEELHIKILIESVFENEMDLVELPKFNVNKIFLKTNRINLSFPSYENLTALTVNVDYSIIINYLKYGLYIFHPDCKKIFKSLVEINFNDMHDNYSALRILFDNIEKVPNIKIFRLKYNLNKYNCKEKLKTIAEFIQKLLNLKLDEIDFKINENYSYDYKFIYSSKLKKYYVSPDFAKLYNFKYI